MWLDHLYSSKYLLFMPRNFSAHFCNHDICKSLLFKNAKVADIVELPAMDKLLLEILVFPSNRKMAGAVEKGYNLILTSFVKVEAPLVKSSDAAHSIECYIVDGANEHSKFLMKWLTL